MIPATAQDYEHVFEFGPLHAMLGCKWRVPLDEFDELYDLLITYLSGRVSVLGSIGNSVSDILFDKKEARRFG